MAGASKFDDVFGAPAPALKHSRDMTDEEMQAAIGDIPAFLRRQVNEPRRAPRPDPFA